MSDHNQEEEAATFSERIQERVQAGYIPDLRRLERNEYFYQSYWRDPYFARLFVGESVNIFLEMIRQYAPQAKTILDVGCGPGYITLEMARNGYHVTGIDIAAGAIETAKETATTNPYTDGFGVLEYHVASFEDITPEQFGRFDVILFSGSLHHIPQPETWLSHARVVAEPDGLIVCHEPSRDTWHMADAAQTALLRMLLTLLELWYQPADAPDTHSDPAKFKAYIEDIFTEYVEEREKGEDAQSPHDNASASAEILAALREHADELEYRPGFAYLYRMLGGLRGPDEQIFKIADFLATYEKVALREGYLSPSTFFWAGRLKA